MERPAPLRTIALLTVFADSPDRVASPGALAATVSFTSREVRQQPAQGGAFVVDPLDAVSFAGDTPTLELRRPNAVTFPSCTLAQFCTDPIEVGSAGSVTPVLRSGHIGQLSFQLPIRVTAAGSYTVSFKITDGNGVEVGQFGLSPNLTMGDNTSDATVLADRLQKSDGPFSIDSVLVVRGSTTCAVGASGCADEGTTGTAGGGA